MTVGASIATTAPAPAAASQAATPPVRAVLVNYNGWRDTIECLESVMRSDYPNLRVIVCDNASSDGSEERIQRWSAGHELVVGSVALRQLSDPPLPKPLPIVTMTRDQLSSASSPCDASLLLVTCGANLGFAGANNVALEYLRRVEPTAHVLLLNNDTVVARDAVRALVASATRETGGGAVAVGATVLRYHEPDSVEMLGGATVSRTNAMVRRAAAGTLRSDPRPGQVLLDYVSGTCMLVSPETLRRVGLLDERYFLYGEDCDWGLRMAAAGVRLLYSPAAEVWHKGGAAIVHRSPLHDYYDVRARLLLVHKHRPLMLPLALAHTAARCTLPKVARGEWARVWAVLRAQRDFVALLLGRA